MNYALSCRSSYPNPGRVLTTRALEIQAEIATYDPVGVIIENIEELAGRSV